MKRACLTLFLLAYLTASGLPQQSAAIAQWVKQRETIWLGTDLTLGMPEDTVGQEADRVRLHFEKV